MLMLLVFMMLMMLMMFEFPKRGAQESLCKSIPLRLCLLCADDCGCNSIKSAALNWWKCQTESVLENTWEAWD